MRLPLLCSALLAVSCGALGSRLDREQAARELERAGAQLEAGEARAAAKRLAAVREVKNLPPDQRLAAEELAERASRVVLDEALARDAGSGALLDLWDLDLAPRVRARAGILAAERLLEEGHRVRAFKQVREVEQELSAYVDRGLAGAVLARAGLELVRGGGRYWLFFRYASRGAEALEFLVVHYPFDPHCPEAYATLVELYAARLDHDEAIERAEDLVVYHPEAPEAVAMLARLPGLRLERLEREDYDRSQMVQAEAELLFWLERYAGREGRPQDEERARATLARCRRRLAESDLVVARFYARVDEPQGVRLHAERALDEARAAGDVGLAGEAEGLLARHAGAPAPGGEPAP